jgi:nucleotide-binding universal stress UspA family protein
VNGLMSVHKKKDPDKTKFLVAIDFSDCARDALRQAKLLLSEKPAQIIALHVIDSDFITECIRHEFGDEGQIKKKLFLEAKAKLRDFLRQENMENDHVQMMVSEGVPYIEINKKAVENNVDMVIIGSCGKTGDMSRIFFGGTTEKVLRFITRPVLCVPPRSEYRMDPRQ